MKPSYYLFLLALLPIFCHSQTTYKTLRIGDKEIRLQPKQMVEVFEENRDTIISYPVNGRDNYAWGSHYRYEVISIDSIVHYSERIEEDSDGLQRAFIQTQSIKNKHSYFVDYDLVNDSIACIKTPLRKIDSIYSVSPYTLDEEITIVYDSTPCFKYNLGTISKADFLATVKSKFGNQLHLLSLGMYVVTDTVTFRSYNLRKPFYKQIEETIKVCKAGTIINLDISHRLSKTRDAYIWNLAFFTFTD